MDQNCQKVLLVFTCLDVQTQISSALSASFSTKFHSIAFYLTQTIPLKKPWNVSSTSELQSWLTKSAINSFGIEISRFCTYRFEFSIKVWIDDDFLKCFSKGTFSKKVPRIGMLIGWTGEVYLIFLFCRFSNSYFSKAFIFKWPDKVSIEMFLLKTGYL